MVVIVVLCCAIFEEKNGECAACLKYSVIIFVEKIYKIHLGGGVAVRPSYI
jgi:hypothetical protein